MGSRTGGARSADAAPRWVAFLRAVNVGGRTVRMEELRGHFEALGYANVATFIASGNVIFDTRDAERTLEATIEKQLAKVLGFETAVFVRSAAALVDIARTQAFPDVRSGGGGPTHYVAFLRDRPAAAAVRRVMALCSATDELRVDGREVWWLCRGSMRESTVSGARLEKALGSPVTVRNLNTIVRLVPRLGVTS